MTNEKEYVELVQNSLSQLDKYQKNAEIIISTFNQLISKQAKEKEYSEEEKLKAAYALNLCTVSVSQIIDYNDILVLEQEYEMILNNLNLENMPKDEALLNILKQLLDTITFFRIQEGDKKFIEKEYQHKMKNAVWSAVPNFGLIVAGGNPITMAVSLASQVGIGYMNYRKAKAENKLEQERQNWKLQRAAIEQLNGLRRELFDTAWRLADEYNFPDEYRLTEKQIGQYNTILMDADSIRKYERLDSIKNKFMAYVPFWYHFGNTANQIAQDLHFSVETRNRYREYAISHFEIFHKLNNKNLLREDQIASACALEYIDLLVAEKDADKINELIEFAVKSSGGSCDVLELCAMAYLNARNINSAEIILRQLVNEDYNAILNAQILSNIYVSNFVYKYNPEIALFNYEILETRVAKDYLFPVPEDGIYDIEKLNMAFCEKQRIVLRTKYHIALNEFIKKYTIKYNKVFPTPNVSKEYDDTYFLDGEAERTKRIENLDAVLSSHRRKLAFCDRLKDDMIVYNLFEVINEMYEAVSKFRIIEDYEFLEIVLTSGIVKCKDSINKMMDAVSNNKIDDINIDMLSELSFNDIVYEFFKELDNQLMDYVDKCENMNNIAVAETELRRFCTSQGLPDSEKLYREKNNLKLKPSSKKIFSPRLLGLDYAEIERANELKRKFKEIVDQRKDRLIIGDKTMLLLDGTTDFDNYFRKMNTDEMQKWKKNTVTIVDAKGLLDIDLLITVKGIVVIRQNSVKELVLYDNVKLENDVLVCDGYDSNILGDAVLGLVSPYILIAMKTYDKMIKKTNIKYKNKSVDLSELYSLICELNNEMPKCREVKDKKDNNSLYGRDYYDFLNTEELI